MAPLALPPRAPDSVPVCATISWYVGWLNSYDAARNGHHGGSSDGDGAYDPEQGVMATSFESPQNKPPNEVDETVERREAVHKVLKNIDWLLEQGMISPEEARRRKETEIAKFLDGSPIGDAPKASVGISFSGIRKRVTQSFNSTSSDQRGQSFRSGKSSSSFVRDRISNRSSAMRCT